MKNRKKALVALAVGAMLAGTTGTTLALWQDTASVNASDIETGSLNIRFASSEFRWEMPDGSVVPNAAMAVGEVRYATATVRPTLQGTNLVGTLRLEHTRDGLDALPANLAVTRQYRIDSGSWTDFNVDSGWSAELPARYNQATLPSEIQVRVRVENKEGTAGAPTAEGIDLGRVTAWLTQTRGGN